MSPSHDAHEVDHSHGHSDAHNPSKEEVTRRVIELFGRYPKTKGKSVNLEAIWADIGLDSFDSVEFSMKFVLDSK